MNKPDYTQQSWIDIIPPSMPVTQQNEFWLYTLIAISLLAIILALFVYAFSKPRWRLYWQLRRLQLETSAERIPSRQSALHIYRILRNSLSEQRWMGTALPAEQQYQWRQYLERLNRAAFAAQAAPKTEAIKLAIEAQTWLHQTGRST